MKAVDSRFDYTIILNGAMFHLADVTESVFLENFIHLLHVPPVNWRLLFKRYIERIV